MTFRTKLRRLMADRHYSKVARRAGLTAATIFGYVNGSFAPKADSALRLAHALNVELSWLIDDRLNWPPIWTNAPAGLQHAPAA